MAERGIIVDNANPNSSCYLPFITKISIVFAARIGGKLLSGLASNTVIYPSGLLFYPDKVDARCYTSFSPSIIFLVRLFNAPIVNQIMFPVVVAGIGATTARKNFQVHSQ